MSDIIFIDVCLATFRRPHLLAEALQSLTRLEIDGLKIRVIVIDNDRDATARDIVEAFRQSVNFEVIYDVEPVQSIPLARNLALSHVLGEYFAFFDDDETVPANWLMTLLTTMQRYEADVVFGPVERHLPPNAPHWAKVQPSFNRSHLATGSQLEHGATNNVLVRFAALGDPLQLFDPVYGLSGCDDTDFFYRLYLAGCRLVWCDDAVVTEHVPVSRVTLKWVRLRGFRGGQSFARVFVGRYPLRKKAVWFVTKILQLLGAIAMIPFARIVSHPAYVHLTVRIMASLGQLSILFSNYVYEEYHADRYK
jgi:succinoglycan biosynthesis protein ExoM